MECPECDQEMVNTEGDLWKCSCGLTLIHNKSLGTFYQGRDCDCPKCSGHMVFDGELFICYSCDEKIAFEDLFYNLPKKQQMDIAQNWDLIP